jgi:catechol 2,3-dioxygenase-like lactoylglutathione lyase family enzyme
MGSITGLDHVQIAAPPGCEADARRFFGDVLGLTELEKPPLLAARGGCWFRVGTHELHVGVADPFLPAAKAHPALRLATEPDLRALAARLQAAGIAVTWADPAEIPGVERFHAADPWGNRLEFVAQTA